MGGSIGVSVPEAAASLATGNPLPPLTRQLKFGLVRKTTPIWVMSSVRSRSDQFHIKDQFA